MPPQAKCNECGTPLALENPQPGDVVECPSCGMKLKVMIVTNQFVRFETLAEAGQGEDSF